MKGANTLESPDPVQKGSVVANVVRELVELSNELDARRRFDEDVTAFLKERGLIADFDAFRKVRSARVPG